jgi:hypothetical protein
VVLHAVVLPRQFVLREPLELLTVRCDEIIQHSLEVLCWWQRWARNKRNAHRHRDQHTATDEGFKVADVRACVDLKARVYLPKRWAACAAG